MKTKHNPIAKHAHKFNVAKVFASKKGKGSFRRCKQVNLER